MFYIFYFKVSEITLRTNYSNFLLVALIAILLLKFNFLCKFHLKKLGTRNEYMLLFLKLL